MGTPACSSDIATDSADLTGKDLGAECAEGDECKSGTCASGMCTAIGGDPTDNIKNGDETDVDCGGLVAPKCADGKACLVRNDCKSRSCVAEKCAPPSPNDGVKNGDETDVDCGGSKAPPCANGKSCKSHDDCASDACSYAKECVEFKSCTRHFGGDTCGVGETGSSAAKHESCCETVENKDGLRIGKYQVTAGRMRAFVERWKGNLQEWASTNPEGWSSDWTSQLPASMENANYMLGPGGKRGCNVTPQGRGSRTYWLPPNGDEKNDFPMDVLDEKALNCVPWVMAQALCVFDGGRLPSRSELVAIMTNDGKHSWPWQFRDNTPYNDKKQDIRVSHYWNYATPNPPADMRMDNGSPLDRSFFIAPPGRFPGSANEIGVQDAVGNMLMWANDAPRRLLYTISWEEHGRKTTLDTWPPTNNPNEQLGYYAIGARCVFD